MTAATPEAPLFDPSGHEPLTGRAWDEARVRAAIVAIVEDAEHAFDEPSLWAVHPLDEPVEPPRVASLYLGAAGVVWALAALAGAGAAELRRDWAAVAVALAEEYQERPDFQDTVSGPVPSSWMGESGILLVAHGLAPTLWQKERLLAAVHANVDNPTRELMWGSPGTMLAAQVMHERTGDACFLAAWHEAADRLWAEWHDDVWLQDIYGSRVHILGPAHGFAGNVLALGRGATLAADRRAELERRTIAVLERYAHRDGKLAQWPPALEPPTGGPQAVRTQWCHGAPGIVASVATLAPDNDELTAILLAGGELTWLAGPLKKGANLCHGTAGNGYAFLKLFERTGDELWLSRARSFAIHASGQVEGATVEYGRGRYSLFTGDPGTALYLQSCLAASAAFPTLDEL